jgi:hypothetical protein
MAVLYIPRSEWGGGSLKSGYRVPEAQFKGLVLHHTVMVMQDYDRDGFLHGDVDDICRYMQLLQVSRPDLGGEVPYSFVGFLGADPNDAVVCEGRGKGVTGAHTINYNSSRYAFSFAGNASTQSVTPGVIEAANWVGRTMLVDPDNAARTFGHRDIKATECPGNTLYAAMPQIQPPFSLAPAPEPTPEPVQEEEDMPRMMRKKGSKGLDKDVVRVIAGDKVISLTGATNAQVNDAKRLCGMKTQDSPVNINARLFNTFKVTDRPFRS